MSDLSWIRSAEPVLIAGLGSVGRRHFENLRALGCSRFVFYRTFRATLPDPEVGDADVTITSDLNEALSQEPRIAVIANPTSKHLEVALPAARAGCNLYIDKPLSHSLDGCDKLAEIVAAKKLTTMIGCQFRFHPLLLSLRAQIQNGRLGEVLGARAEWGEYLPDWHAYEDFRQSYSARKDLGGGVILTLIHPFDYLQWMFGSVERAVGLTSDVSSLKTTVPDEWAEIILKFSSGQVASVHLDFIQKPPVHRLQVWGDRGRATWNFHEGTLAWQSADGGTETENVEPGFDRNAMFVDAMREFLSAVHERRPSSIPLADGIAVLKTALDAKASAAKEACCA